MSIRGTQGSQFGPLRGGSQYKGHQSRPEQLPMFMSANEIEERYAPLDGDRLEVQDFSDPQMRVLDAPARGQAWGDFASSGNRPSSADLDTSDRPGTQTAFDEVKEQWAGVNQDKDMGIIGSYTRERRLAMLPPVRNQRNMHISGRSDWRDESSTELWNRKRDEAEFDELEPVENDEGEFEFSQTLAESVREHGVQKPISLGQQFGSEGKPMIVGGHHRLAVMRDHDPDQLLPVLHHRDIRSAKNNQSYRYT